MRILKMLELFARLSDTLLEVNAYISAKTTLFVADGTVSRLELPRTS
jgi:hypothetical protein